MVKPADTFELFGRQDEEEGMLQVRIPEKVDLPAREACKSGVSKVNAVCFFKESTYLPY